MAVTGRARIASEFYDSIGVGQRWRVVLWDLNKLTGSSLDYTIPVEDIDLTYESESDPFTAPLKPSTLKVVFGDDGSAEFTSIRTDIALAQENQFYLILYKYNGSAFYHYWCGLVMTDMVTWDNVWADANHPRSFEVIAKDGLNRLANIEFDKVSSSPYISGSVTTPQSFYKIIFDCLSYSGSATFWQGTAYGNGNTYMKVNTTWHDANMIVDNSTPAKLQTRSLEITRIDRDFMFDHYQEDNDPKYKYKDRINTTKPLRIRSKNDPVLKTKVVLSELLTLTGLRMVLTDGIWYLTQIATYAQTTAKFANYTYLGVYDTESSPVNLQKTPTVMGGGQFGYYPSLKSATVSIMPSEILGQVHEGMIMNVDADTYDETYQLGTIYGGAGFHLKIHIPIQFLKWNDRDTQNGDILLNFTITVVCGSYRVTARRVGIYDEGEMTWTTTAADKYTFKDGKATLFVAAKKGSSGYMPMVFETTDIPFAVEEDCTMRVQIELSRAFVALPPADELSFQIQDIAVGVVDALNGDYAKIAEYEAINDDATANSIIEEFGKLNIHDTGAGGNKVSVETDEYVGAARWVKSTDWDADHLVDETLVNTILKEAISLQKAPISKYDGAFRDNSHSTCFNPWGTLIYDSRVWVWNSLKFDFKLHEWSGQFWAINRVTTDITVGNPEKRPDTRTETNPMGLGPWNVWPVNYMPNKPLETAKYPIIKAILNGYANEGDNLSGTPIDIYSSEYSHLWKGDNVLFINPNTGRLIDSGSIEDSVNSTDTSMAGFGIPSLDGDINEGVEVSTNANELMISNELRAVEKQTFGSYENGAAVYILKAYTANTTATELTTNGLTGSGVLNRIWLPTDCSFHCIATVLAKKEASAVAGKWAYEFIMTNNGGTTALEGAVTGIGTDIFDAALTACVVTITANNTDDAISVSVNGIAATNINWTCKVDVTKSIY